MMQLKALIASNGTIKLALGICYCLNFWQGRKKDVKPRPKLILPFDIAGMTKIIRITVIDTVNDYGTKDEC